MKNYILQTALIPTVALLISMLPDSLHGRTTPNDDDILIADFEGDTYGDWEETGKAFGGRPAKGTLPNQHEVTGFIGNGLVNSFFEGDKADGTLMSPEFEIERPYITFLIAGGSRPEVGMDLLIDGQQVRIATGNESEQLSPAHWNVEEFMGKTARVRIFDAAVDGWGHINVDHIVQTNVPPAVVMRLEDYRETEVYYRERYRPQFHFTPEMNWMNDPNGLVYFDGEYHLFYQHNPHGNEWGHMSWGHAVSDDLVHWKHLPIALHDEHGVMIFSGCCVIDHDNTSGFGNGETPPMVAIYTGHGYGKQTQDLAYSNDRGRTWTKYRGNPVIDLNNPDFRDPKVFWHEETSRWIMLVSLAKELKISFYGSPDLKEWTHLSDFGPAGVEGKPNWECPDLFELPVEDEDDRKRWVLEVDMGDASVAGGSGGEYFIGDFDGTSFMPDKTSGESQWVDYGRDFYAPVSWSNMPRDRKIWIGWMNNWQTHLLPTTPWRSAMSIPRELSLRRVNGELRMIQQPVRELKSLRGRMTAVETLVNEKFDLGGLGVSGNQLEIEAVIDVANCDQTGLSLLKGENHETVVGYDQTTGEVFVDRTQSGEVDFHENFAGRHAAPAELIDGKINLRIFIDISSVEVFINDGEAVITDRVFRPAPVQWSKRSRTAIGPQ